MEKWRRPGFVSTFRVLATLIRQDEISITLQGKAANQRGLARQNALIKPTCNTAQLALLWLWRGNYGTKVWLTHGDDPWGCVMAKAIRQQRCNFTSLWLPVEFTWLGSVSIISKVSRRSFLPPYRFNITKLSVWLSNKNRLAALADDNNKNQLVSNNHRQRRALELVKFNVTFLSHSKLKDLELDTLHLLLYWYNKKDCFPDDCASKIDEQGFC